jgi:hypothetical protein
MDRPLPCPQCGQTLGHCSPDGARLTIGPVLFVLDTSLTCTACGHALTWFAARLPRVKRPRYKAALALVEVAA